MALVTKKNACKVLTQAQLQQVLGGEATFRGKAVANKNLDVVCDWAISASGDRPAGTVRVASAVRE